MRDLLILWLDLESKQVESCEFSLEARRFSACHGLAIAIGVNEATRIS